jgi:asparagine synthase (glutamine-hydrolysing)
VTGIAGVWNLDGAPPSAAERDAVMKPLAHRAPNGAAWFRQGGVAICQTLPRSSTKPSVENGPFVGRRGDVLVWDGRLDDREALVGALGASASDLDRSSPDAAIVVAAFERWDTRFLERLSGDFALAVFRPIDHVLYLARDAIGSRPLYWARSRSTVVFASEASAVAGHPSIGVQPNRRLLARTLVPTAPYDEEEWDTFYQCVMSVRPSHVLEFTASSSRRRRYWDFSIASTAAPRSFETRAEAFRETFDRAVRRRVRSASPIAISVSGGLDSSSVFAIASLRASTPIHGLTFSAAAGSAADESEYVRELEDAYGTEIERVPLRPAGTLEGALRITTAAEGPAFIGLFEAQDRLNAAACASGAEVLLTGQFGDQVLANETYLSDLIDHLHVWTALAHLKEIPRWNQEADRSALQRAIFAEILRVHIPRRLTRPLRRLRADRRARERPWLNPSFRTLADDIRGPERIPTQIHSHGGRTLYSGVRSSGWVSKLEFANKSAARRGLDVSHPFMDRDVVELLLNTPGAEINHAGVPKAIVRAALRDLVPASIFARRTKADFTGEVVHALLTNWQEVREVLEDAVALSQFEIALDGAIPNMLPAWERAVERGDIGSVRIVMELLSTEVWLRSSTLV